MDSKAIKRLPENTSTDRTWNFRDDINQNYFGEIPRDQAAISLTLYWKESNSDTPRLVGRFRIHLPTLEEEGLVRRSERGWILRFQRDGNRIEIATNRTSKALEVGTRPAP